MNQVKKMIRAQQLRGMGLMKECVNNNRKDRGMTERWINRIRYN
jgi:hypothetical protein